jgi:hypothetical protein
MNIFAWTVAERPRDHTPTDWPGVFGALAIIGIPMSVLWIIGHFLVKYW